MATQPSDLEPIRAVFVIDSLVSGAGTENQLRLLLSSFTPGRIESVAITVKDRVPMAHGFRVLALGQRRLASIGGILGLFRTANLLRQSGSGVVITLFFDGNFHGTISGRLAGVPVVSCRRSLGRGYWDSTSRMRQLRLLDRITHRWLANSEAVRQYTAEAEGVPLDRITVIRNAIDTDRFRPPTGSERQAARRSFSIPDRDRAVACVANLRPVKDHRNLLRAFSLVLRSLPNLRLLLAGCGAEESALRSVAAELDIADRVHFLGSLDNTVRLYHAVDAAVLSSVSESLPNAILEALACGLPVASTNVGGVPEVLAGHPFGRLAPPSDPEPLAAALSDVFCGPAQDPAAQQAARDYAVTNFSLPVILEQWYGFLEMCRKETGR